MLVNSIDHGCTNLYGSAIIKIYNKLRLRQTLFSSQTLVSKKGYTQEMDRSDLKNLDYAHSNIQ